MKGKDIIKKMMRHMKFLVLVPDDGGIELASWRATLNHERSSPMTVHI